MAISMQQVYHGDTLRLRTFQLNTRSTVGTSTSTLQVFTNLDHVMVEGLSGTGGTIQYCRARCATAPTGTITATRLDVRVNGTTIFTATGSSIKFPMTATGGVMTTAPQAFITQARRKVFNGDVLRLDCASVGDGVPGTFGTVVVVVRADEPNDTRYA